MNKASQERQVSAAQAGAGAAGDQICKTVCEVISGSLPAHERTEMLRLLNDGNVSKVYVESVRAVARSAKAAEELWEHSVAKNVTIVPTDMPSLLTHTPTPVEKFLRRVVCAVTELERDVLVARLRDGVSRRLRTTRQVTQTGSPKVTGARTLLQKVKPTAATLRKLRVIAMKRAAPNSLGLRTLARSMSDALQLPRTMGHETARRLCRELDLL